MITISFTENLRRHVEAPSAHIEGTSVLEALENYFKSNPDVRDYVLDNQGSLRKHVAIFLNQELIHDRIHLSDSVNDNDEIFVVQALSGG